MNISEITGQRRPIGYWIKHLHDLVEGSLDALLADQGLTRRHWQVLNVVATDSPALADLDTTLAPFLDDRRPSLRPLTDDLRERGWLEEGERVTLTAAGIRAHEDLRQRVNTSRARLTEGIGAEEYLATIDVLSRMSANLTRPDGARRTKADLRVPPGRGSREEHPRAHPMTERGDGRTGQ